MNKLLLFLFSALALGAQTPWTHTSLATSYDDVAAPGYTNAVAQIVIPGIPGKVHHVTCLQFSAQANVLGGGIQQTEPTAVLDTHANVHLAFGPGTQVSVQAEDSSGKSLGEIIRWFVSFPYTAAGVAREYASKEWCPSGGLEGKPGEALFFGFSREVNNVMQTVFISGYDY